MDTNLFLLQSAAATARVVQESWQLRNTIVIGVVGLLGTGITTLGTILLARIGANTKSTAIAAQATAETAKATDGKTSVLLEKTEQVHTLTNSNLTKVTTALEVMTTKNSELEKMVVSLNQRITEYERQNVITSFVTQGTVRQESPTRQESPVKQEIKEVVKEAVCESVPAPVIAAVKESVGDPVKQAVLDSMKSLSKEQIESIIKTLNP